MALRISSREYKVMLKRGLFADREAGIKEFRRALRSIGTKAHVVVDGEFDDISERQIVFFDTGRRELCEQGLVLRRRERKKKIEYTLKCRSPDRFIAAGANIRSSKRFASDEKFEEDISAPFQSRFSHSTTIIVPRDKDVGPPKSIEEAAKLFPDLRDAADKRKSWINSRLTPVGKKPAFERVYTGTLLEIDGQPATVALIIWSTSKTGKPLLVEFSFRYKAPKEKFSPSTATVARDMFDALQKSSWFDPDARTKTQTVFDR